MKFLYWVAAVVFFAGCTSVKKMQWPERNSSLTGNEFYHQAFAMKWKERDSFALKEVLAGNIPSFLKKFVPVHVSIADSASGKIIEATYYVAPDYLSIGS